MLLLNSRNQENGETEFCYYPDETRHFTSQMINSKSLNDMEVEPTDEEQFTKADYKK